MNAKALFTSDDDQQDTEHMGHVEGLVLLAMRRWVAGRVGWEITENDFRRTFGTTDGPVALLTITQLLIRFCLYGRRPLRFGIIGLPWISADEMALLQLVAVAQSENDLELALRLEWIFPSGACDDAPPLLRRLAAILEEHGHGLPLRRRPS